MAHQSQLKQQLFLNHTGFLAGHDILPVFPGLQSLQVSARLHHLPGKGQYTLSAFACSNAKSAAQIQLKAGLPIEHGPMLHENTSRKVKLDVNEAISLHSAYIDTGHAYDA